MVYLNRKLSRLIIILHRQTIRIHLARPLNIHRPVWRMSWSCESKHSTTTRMALWWPWQVWFYLQFLDDLDFYEWAVFYVPTIPNALQSMPQDESMIQYNPAISNSLISKDESMIHYNIIRRLRWRFLVSYRIRSAIKTTQQTAPHLKYIVIPKTEILRVFDFKMSKKVKRSS